MAMLFSEEAVPSFETGFMPTNDIEKLLSFIYSNDNEPVSPNSGSEEGTSSSRAVYSADERKKRRMISNRESARRSRWRKKKHLENLTDQLNRLNIENRKLKNQLGSIVSHYHVLWRENECLRSESVALSARLSDLRTILAAMVQYSPYSNHQTL